jgi:hypothetical protein
VIRTPVQAPNANANAERWVRTIRSDCLDRILILGRRHLERILRVYQSTTTGTGRTVRSGSLLQTAAAPQTTTTPAQQPPSDVTTCSADSSTNTNEQRDRVCAPYGRLLV